MSTTEELNKLIDSLLNKSWAPEEKILLKKLSDNLLYYKKMIPKTLKLDVIAVLQMANTIKTDYDLLKVKLDLLNNNNNTDSRSVTANEIVVESIEHSTFNEQQGTSIMQTEVPLLTTSLDGKVPDQSDVNLEEE